MDIREAVRLKPGAGGLQPPLNYGIILDRVRSRKENSYIVFTLKGRMTLGKRLIKEGTGRTYGGGKGDEKGMVKFLNGVISSERSRNSLDKDPQQIINETGVEDLWGSAALPDGSHREKKDLGTDIPDYCDGIALTAEEIGLAHFAGYSLDPNQISAVSKILSASHPQGEPFFERLRTGKGAVYSPYSRSAVRSIEDHINRLKELKSQFIEWVDDEDDERGSRKRPRRRAENIKDIILPEKTALDMDIILRWCLFYMENARWPSFKEIGKNDVPDDIPDFGLGGTPAVCYGDFKLEDYLDLFTMDLAGSRKRDLPSNIILILLKLERISWREASYLIARFHMASGSSKFRGKFPSHVIRSSRSLPDGVRSEDEEGRIDLSDLETYTIDPSDAKDFDDAVSLESCDGETVIWVHIADVSHYVKPHDQIDTEARFRGTSVYLPTGVIPMLPGELSENLCSLREGVKRLALSTRIRFDPNMEIIDWEHVQSVIRVDRNLTYEAVDGWIEEGKEPFSSLWNVAKSLERIYRRLNIETPERRIRYTGDNEISIEIKRPTKATRLIEQLMVITNECAAEFLREREIPAVYRVHPLPDRSSIEKFNDACRAMQLGFYIDTGWIEGDEEPDKDEGGGVLLSALLSGSRISLGGVSDPPVVEMAGDSEVQEENMEPADPKRMASALEAFNDALRGIDAMDDRTSSDIIKVRMLRTMPRAFYSSQNLGHFGLGSVCYCHFTSPIRRYPDLIVHRAVKNAISGREWNEEDISGLDILIDGINEMAQMAEEWERQMGDVALCIRSEMDHGIRTAVHPCRISSISMASCYVTLEDNATEGRIPISSMDKHHLAVDDSESRIVLNLDDNPEYMKDHAGELTSDQISEGEIVLHRLGDRIRCGFFNIQPAWGRIEMYRG
ncbi:MAG: RNB domain-containing ribonuclease [Thermoplasmatota archaeon]